MAANWHRKDYEAIAELTAEMIGHMTPTVVAHTMIAIAIEKCYRNAALDSNGNRNFKSDVFRKRVVQLLGRDDLP